MRSSAAAKKEAEHKADTHFHPLVLQYLAAIGFDLSKAALSLEVVSEILHKHGLTFAMTTLPANKQDRVELEFENLTGYLLKNGYGFCYHHNVTVHEVLKALGFEVNYIAASVRVPPACVETFKVPTHVALVLTLKSQRYLVDPGWNPQVSKPILLDTIDDTNSEIYQLANLSAGRYAFVQLSSPSQKTIRYEFDCTPVPLKNFQAGLATVMSRDYPFYHIFLYQIRRHNGDLHSIVNRKFTTMNAEGVIQTTYEFKLPAKYILKKFSLLSAKQADELRFDTFTNPILGELMTKFLFPKRDHLTLHSAVLAKGEPSIEKQPRTSGKVIKY